MTVEHVQTKREIATLLDRLGASPRRRLGQNFLIDGNLMRRLVASADLAPTDRVLEVGGGTGGLTDLLAERAGELLCVEIDRALHTHLCDRFTSNPRVRVLQADILESKHRVHTEVAQFLQAKPRGSAKLVANLPYQIATPLVMNLLADYPNVDRLCFTVQREVGERFTARPNSKAYGPLSILTQVLCQIETVARLPATAFWPQPSVESVMLRLDVVDPPFADSAAIGRFVRLVRATFEHRRKTLRSALRTSLDAATIDGVCDSFDGTRRPEALDVKEWVALFQTTEG